MRFKIKGQKPILPRKSSLYETYHRRISSAKSQGELEDILTDLDEERMSEEDKALLHDRISEKEDIITGREDSMEGGEL